MSIPYTNPAANRDLAAEPAPAEEDRPAGIDFTVDSVGNVSALLRHDTASPTEGARPHHHWRRFA